MNTEKKYYSISIEEAMKDPAMRPLAEDLIKTSAEVQRQALLTEKYRKGLKFLTRLKIKKLHKTHPEWHLNDLLAAVVKGYNPELPAVVMLEMTQFIIEEWEKTKQPDPEAVLA